MSIAESTDSTWRAYELDWDGGTIHAEPAGWKDPGFDDSGWAAVTVVSGAPNPPFPPGTWYNIANADFIVGPPYSSGHVKDVTWITRNEFEITGSLPDAAVLTYNCDDDVDIYVNGDLVVSLTGPGSLSAHTVDVLASLIVGTNCIGAVVHNTAGSTSDPDWNSYTRNPTMFQARLDSYPPAAGGVVIDWENDGFLEGDYDDVSANVVSWSITRGSGAEVTSGANPGSATLVLKNPDDIYNPRNESSPLYGFLRDGPPIWIGVNADGALAGSNPRGLFGGRIADITLIPAGGAVESPMVEISCEDMLGWARREPIRIDYDEGLSQSGFRQVALVAAGETHYDLAHEILTMPLSHADSDLLTVLESINAANGTRHFAKPADNSTDWFAYTTRNRQWRLDATVDADLSASTDHATDTSGWRLSADTTTNRQRATVTPIKFTPGTFTVWEADQLPISVSDTRPYTRIVSFDDVVRDAVLDLAYTGDTVTSTLTPFADSAKITLTVGAGDAATITALSVEGRLARRLPDESYEANDVTSQTAPRGIRAGSDISGEYVGVIAAAAGIAEHVVWRYAEPQLRPTLTVENWTPDQFDRDLYDVISFTSTQLDMTARLFEIVGLTHESDFAASAAAHLHTTTYVLQECRVQEDPGWFVLDTSELDSADILAY